MKKLLMVLVVVAFAAPAANAIPHLQIYIEGASYNTTLESWVISASNFKLWVIGDVGAYGSIFDVKVAASGYGTGGSVTLSPTTTALVTDPSTPGAVSNLGTDETQFESGGAYESPAFTPVKSHAEYANADEHYFYGIGDFTLTDSPIGDFQGWPGTWPDMGQINVYDVSVSGYDAVHFDAFDHTVETTGNHTRWAYWKVPPSHDGTGGGDPVPEPGTLGLIGAGLAGLAIRLRRRS